MAINKKRLAKLTKDFILPRVMDKPPSIFDEVTKPDWKPSFPIYYEKKKDPKNKGGK